MSTPGDPYSCLLLTAFVVKSFSLSIALAIAGMALLLVFTALLSAAESAFFALGPADIEKIKSSESTTDDKILELVEKPKRLLATLVISTNFVNIAIVLISTFIIENLFDFGQSPLMGFVFQVVVVTFLILLVGEAIPKIYATQNPLKASKVMIYPVIFLEKLFYPLSSFLIFSTSVIDKRVKRRGHNMSVDELSQALELTSEEEIPQDDHKILKGIVQFGNLDVKQIMKPRLDVVAFEYNTRFSELLVNILNSGFSRLPVFKGTLDTIEGVLYIKDLLPHLEKGDDFAWQGLIRPPFFVPENKKIDDLLREFQFKKIHLAVVVDEFGGTSGIVTLEDVIEEIVGEINDEFDDVEMVYSKLDDNNYVFEGKALLNDVCRIMEMENDVFESVKGESDTLAGLLIELGGRIPAKNDKIKFSNMLFTVESADSRKVKRVKITVQ